MTICDCIIIGAGPAGTTAAKIIAKAGKSCIVIEKQKDFTNRKCAGAMNLIQALKFGIDPTPVFDAALQPIKGAKIYSPNGNFFEIKTEDFGYDIGGYILDRDRFDERLARDAEKAGAELVMNYLPRWAITDIDYKDGIYSLTRLLKGGEYVDISSKYLIDASGFWSVAGKKFGITSTLPYNEYHICLQYTIKTEAPWRDNEIISIFPSKNIAPFGYAWVFPLNDGDTIRVGLGMHPKAGNPREYLNDFLLRKNINGEIINTISGPIPLSKLRKTRKGNLFVVGDAGAFCDPLTGGGIINAIVSGRAAGKAVVADNPKVFDKEIKPLKRMLRRRWFARKFFYGISDTKMEKLIVKMKKRRFRSTNVDRELLKLLF